MRSLVIPANEYRRSRWRNGAGWTREIHARGPRGGAADGGSDWDWRLSIAEIEQPSTYSRFDGIEREQVLLHGNGLDLRFSEGTGRALEPPHGRCRFSGELGVEATPVDQLAHVFNLMWRRDAVEAQLWHRPLVGPMVVFAEPGVTWIMHLIAGQARFADDSGLPGLCAGDTALLESESGRLRHVLDGSGEALVIRIQPLE
ncbi:HutD family protein [Luteimonas vadosa]|uniref:HutD family protein n=1 Tax=Luteimonas vadosa TaxID=1165507 RepID=A0ABP9E1L1_9GAMM